MKTITKHCTTMKQAERHQTRLYNQYNHVRLIRSPILFGEAGVYVWEVQP